MGLVQITDPRAELASGIRGSSPGKILADRCEVGRRPTSSVSRLVRSSRRPGVGKRVLCGVLPTGKAGAAHSIWRGRSGSAGRAGRAARFCAGGLASVSGGGGFEGGGAEGLEPGEQFVEPPVVVDPGGVVAVLVGAEPAADRLTFAQDQPARGRRHLSARHRRQL
jgi:hypothetical protein